MNRDISAVSSDSERSAAHWTPLFLAWLLALLATAGALFLGEVMGKTPPD